MVKQPAAKPVQQSRAAAEFERQYEHAADPWGYESNAYERAKYATTLAALPQARYTSALEIGCSIGVLTALLAPRCDYLLAIDFAETALTRARARLAQQSQVEFRRLTLPDEYPPERFDLTLLSEVGYYWSWRDLRAAKGRMIAGLISGGHLLLVHWTPPIDDAPLNGDEVHEEFLHRNGDLLDHLGGQRLETYRLDLFARRQPDGTAAAQLGDDLAQFPRREIDRLQRAEWVERELFPLPPRHPQLELSEGRRGDRLPHQPIDRYG